MTAKLAVFTLAGMLLAGCTQAKFHSKSSSSESKSSASSPALASDLPAACQNGLRSLGFSQVSADIWKSVQRVPCTDGGFGYVEREISVNETSADVCSGLSHLSTQAGVPTDLSKYGRSIPGNFSFPGATVRDTPHCVATVRCHQAGLSEGGVIKLLAWIKKCENQVPAFAGILQILKEAQAAQGDRFRLGNAYPQIVLTTGTLPAGSISATGLHTVDDLGAAQILSQVTEPCPRPQDVEPIVSVCATGCYRGDQRILVSADGSYEPIQAARESSTRTIAVMARGSTLESPRYENAPIGHFIASAEDSSESLLHIRTLSGLALVVTKNHPLLDGEGYMREAAQLKVGDSLVQADGRRDVIVGIDTQEFFGKVYNVAPQSPFPDDNLIVSEGIINGSHNYQTELHEYIGRQVLRSRLAEGL